MCALASLINNKAKDRAAFVPLLPCVVRNTCILNGDTLGNSAAWESLIIPYSNKG